MSCCLDIFYHYGVDPYNFLPAGPRAGDESLLPLPDFEKTFPGLVEKIQNAHDAIRNRGEPWQTVRDSLAKDVAGVIAGPLPEWKQIKPDVQGHTLLVLLLSEYPSQMEYLYKGNEAKHKNLIRWTALLHDISKLREGGDASHPFRCAASAGRIMHRLGLSRKLSNVDYQVKQWSLMTLRAVQYGENCQLLQDNACLPQILRGIDRIFGADTEAALLIKLTLLHQSLSGPADYPPPSKLSTYELGLNRRHITRDLLRCMCCLSTADTLSYLWDKEKEREVYPREIREQLEETEDVFCKPCGPADILNKKEAFYSPQVPEQVEVPQDEIRTVRIP